MKNFLQVNRALRAKKNFNFNFKSLFVLLAVLITCINTAWGAVATFSGSNLNAAAGDKTVGSITLSTSDMTYSSGLYASGSAKTFTLTASGGATISQVVITMSGTSNRYIAGNITNCTSCTRDGSVYTCTISPAASSVACKNNGGGVTITQLDVTYGSAATYYYRGEDNSWGSTLMTPSAGGTYEYISTTRNNHQFKITTCNEAIGTWNCSNIYDRYKVDAGFYSTSISTIGNYGETNCYVWSAPASYNIIIFKPNTAINTTNNPKICASATLPKDRFTISFNEGDGSGSMSSITNLNAGANQAVTANSFTAPSGYQFAGWVADVDVKVGGSTQTAGTVLDDGVTIQNILSDIELTAQWEVIPTYDVTYNTNGGDGGSTSGLSDQSDGYIFNVATNGFTKTGYVFKWWNTASDGTGVDYYQGEPDTIKSADINLYAQWESVASNEEYWVGSPYAWTSSKITVGDMVITPQSTSDVDINTGLTASTSSTIVNKQSGLQRHAKVLALKNDNKYLQVHFSDGSPINELHLGATTNSTDNKNIVVVYSTTADFSSGEYEFKKVGSTDNLVQLSGYNQATKYVTDVSPSTTDKYYYARIYKKLSDGTDYNSTGGNLGSGSTIRIYSIKAKKGASCEEPTASWSTAPADGVAGSRMNAVLTTNYAAGVTYTSSNTNVAVVTGDGTGTCYIDYMGAGTARITASVLGDGSTYCARTASCYTDITVTANPRVFKSGELVYFKDASGNLNFDDKSLWKRLGGDLCAYFYDDATPTANGAWAVAGTCVSGSMNGTNAIYEIEVPQLEEKDHEWTGVIFTRGANGSAYPFDAAGFWDQTQDQSPAVGYNMFKISNDKDGSNHWKGVWDRYAKNPALVGGFNSWFPDANVFGDYASNVGTTCPTLNASTTFDFKVLDGESYYSFDNSGAGWTVTGTTTTEKQLYTNNAGNMHITTTEAGSYVFKYNKDTHKLIAVYYPKERLTKNTILYFDAGNSTYWTGANFHTKFEFKQYDNLGTQIGYTFCDDRIDDSEHTWVYYTTVPDNDKVGGLQIMRFDPSSNHGTQWNYTNANSVGSRSSVNNNCAYITTEQASSQNTQTLAWKTYCPPTTSETFTDNSTSKISWASGAGTSENPYLVPASGTIEVQASASKAVNDGNMTINYDFKVDDSSAQPGEGNTYSKGSLSNNTTYKMSVDAYTVYNLDDSKNSTKHTPTALYYKALTMYSVTHNVNYATSSDRTGSGAAAYYQPYTATFTPSTGYNLPATITVKFGDDTKTSGTDYTWNSSTGVVSIPADKIDGNVTIKFDGVAKTTSITLDDNDENHGTSGDGAATATFDSGTLTSVTHTTPETGYHCVGYFTSSSEKIITAEGALVKNTTYTTNEETPKWKSELAELTLYAHYEINTYTVNFASNNDSYGTVNVASISSVEHGEEVSIDGNELTLNGTTVTATKTTDGADYSYAFSGWSVSNGDAITGNTNITATFTATAKQYSVTHSLTNMTASSGATGPNAATYGTNYTATLNASSGYIRPASITVTAGGSDITASCTWNSSTGALTIPGTSILGNITITAAGELVYTVTFESNGGSSVASITQASEGASITMPSAPSYTNYTFQGWVIGGTTKAVGASYTPTANVTAYASWEATCTGGGEDFYFSKYVSSPLSANTDKTKLVSTTTKNTITLECQSNTNTSTRSTDTGTGIVDGTSINFSSSPTYIKMSSGDTIAFTTTTTSTIKVQFITASNDNSGIELRSTSKTGTLIESVLVSSKQYKFQVLTASANPAGKYVIVAKNKEIDLGEILVSYTGGTCYYVTYDGNGAEAGLTSDPTAYNSSSNTVTVKANGAGGAAYTKSGYTFDGWNTKSDGSGDSKSAGGTFTITKDTVLYAKWALACSSTPAAPSSLTNGATTTNTQVVTWTANDEDTWEVYHSTSSSTPGTDQTPTATVTSATYTFTGLTASTQYYWWARSKCDASHKSSWVAGTSFTTSTPTYTLTATAVKNMTGMFTGSTTITNSPVVGIESGTSVSSSDNTFTIGETTVTAPTTIAGKVTVDDGGTPYNATCTWRFDHWNNLPATVTADVDDVEAEYVPSFPINYTLGGGSFNSTYPTYYVYTDNEEDRVTLSTDVSKDGYTFDHWEDAGGTTRSYITCDYWGAFNMTAVWTPNDYTITYHLNGASWASSAGVAEYTVGTGATLPLSSAMTNTGYTFNGWYANSDLSTGGVVTSIGTSEYGNKEYWAKWTENSYTITYDKNNGSATGSTSNTVGHYVTVADCGFELANNIFMGWNTKDDGSGASYAPGEDIELTANMTLYAQWASDFDVAWTITKIDSKLYRGGGGYTVTAVIDDASWDAVAADANKLELSATDGVTLRNITKSINGDDKAQITANFDITTDVDEDATQISFTLSVPENNGYGAKDDVDEEDLDACPGGGSTTVFSLTSITGVGSNLSTSAKDVGAYYDASSYCTLNSVSDGVYVGGCSWSGSFSGKNLGYESSYHAWSFAQNMIYLALYSATGFAAGDVVTMVEGTSNTQSPAFAKASASTLDDLKNTDYNHYTAYQLTMSSETAPASGNSYTYTGTIPAGFTSSNWLIVYRPGQTFKLQSITITRSGGSGGVSPTLTWDSDPTSAYDEFNAIPTEIGDELTYTASTTSNTLGAITYSIAWDDEPGGTINPTTGKVQVTGPGNATITATLAASGCYNGTTITYDIYCAAEACSDPFPTITTTDRGCSGIELSVPSGSAGYQWYKDDAEIDAATNYTYTATEEGEYYVIVTNSCDRASNTVEIEAKGSVSASKIVDNWYVKNGRRTPDVALVQTTDATGFFVKIGDDKIWDEANDVTTGFGGCGFYLGEDGIIYLKGQKNDGTAPSGLDANKTLKITATGCSGNADELSINIKWQDETARPSVAFVSLGTEKGAFTDTTAGYYKTTPLYKYLDYTLGGGAFDLTAQNIYSTVDEQALREHYSQFDAILITDDPNTGKKKDGKSYVDAMGALIDIRPMLTMEAFVSALSNWKAKGINGNPTSPNPRQYGMKLECKDHEIFTGLSAGGNVKVETIDGVDYWTVLMVDSTKSPYNGVAYNASTSDKPALQGFSASNVSGLMLLGEISDGALYAGVERQDEPAARLMLLGLNNKALPNALTDEGKRVISNALEYLCKTNMEDVDDCSNYFTGATNTDWNTASNWSKAAVPTSPTVNVRILAPVELPASTTVRVHHVDIVVGGKSKEIAGTPNGSLTIPASSAMVVTGTVTRATAPYYGIEDLMPTEVNDIYIAATSTNNGTLILNNEAGTTKATVEMYSKGGKVDGKKRYQYIGTPHSDVNNAQYNYYGSWLYEWTGTGWEKIKNGAAVKPWTGYCISYPTTGHTYVMEGTLVATTEKDIAVGADQNMVVGNSWTAPMYIKNFTDDDFDNLVGNVYFFNTGVDAGGSAGDAKTRYEASTYVTVPIHSSPYTGDSLISSMQGFFVKSNGSEGTLHLDYNRLVRPTGTRNVVSGEMHAPRRVKAENEEPDVLKLTVRGENYDDRLVLLRREDFSEGFDNGWDGDKWDGNSSSLYLYTPDEEVGDLSVSALPELEGTVVGFRAGEDNAYTIYFDYSNAEEPLYWYDADTRTYTPIVTGEEYRFFTNDKEKHTRFLITRTNSAQTPTGIEDGSGGDGVRAKKFILENKLFIMVNGKLYDATGKVVK